MYIVCLRTAKIVNYNVAAFDAFMSDFGELWNLYACYGETNLVRRNPGDHRLRAPTVIGRNHIPEIDVIDGKKVFYHNEDNKIRVLCLERLFGNVSEEWNPDGPETPDMIWKRSRCCITDPSFCYHYDYSAVAFSVSCRRCCVRPDPLRTCIHGNRIVPEDEKYTDVADMFG
jgi:hypothetical protein